MQLVESCWVEIDPGYNKAHIIVGCVYRHPTADLSQFTSQMEEILNMLNLNKYQVYILGDMNINFLNFSNHIPTEEYLDMLYSNNFLPIITKPTRITNHTSTLIDHIYTNTPIEQITPGIATMDISDHLPIFCIVDSNIRRKKTKKIF